MLALLERIAANPDTNSIDDLTAVMQKLRPAKPGQLEQASTNIRTFTQLLQGKRSHAIALRHYLLNVFSARNQTRLYTDTGILPSNGFFSELFQRFTYRLLPPAVSDHCLRDCLDRVLPNKSDYLWMAGVPAEDWLALFCPHSPTCQIAPASLPLVLRPSTNSQTCSATHDPDNRVNNDH